LSDEILNVKGFVFFYVFVSDIIKKRGGGMDFQWAKMTMFICMIVGIIVTVLAAARNSLVMAVIGYGIIIAGIIVRFLYYRCPHCRASWFNIRGPAPKHCPECGKEIEQENY